MDSVRIFDTTLRDGEQSPGFSMNTAEKIRIARQLAKLGVDVIEAGFPISSRRDPDSGRLVGQGVRDVPDAAPARGQKGERYAAHVGPGTTASPRLPPFLCNFEFHP